MADAETATDGSGQYSFTGLRSGTYSVEISGFDTNEVSFSSTSGAATVGVGESKVVSFDGTYLRTAGVMGQVTIVDSGEGLAGVTVTLLGEGVDRTEVTNASGNYAFSQLKGGSYQVAISGYDTDDYEFKTTSKSVTIATGESANVPFEGTLLRTAGIAGRVSVEGMGLDGVTVTLAGAAEKTATTSNGGQYGFAALAAGTYVLTITNPDEVSYAFDDANLTRTVVLADDQAAIENFEGTHQRTATISGVLFIDEAPQDEMLSDGEPTVVEALAPFLASLDDMDPKKAMITGLLANAKVSVRGPDINTVDSVPIMPDGSFTTGATLMKGTYQIELTGLNDPDVMKALEAAGVAFVGGSETVELATADGQAAANFPFRITHQTVNVEAVMGRAAEEEIPADRDRVEKVKLKLYANADGTGMLAEGETDAMGMASFTFARADNTAPGGTDNIVFVSAESPSDALAISDNSFVEVAYDGRERVSSAAAAVRLVNVAVNFDFWVKNKEMGRGGDAGLGGWAVQYCTPMADNPETDEKDPVVCEGKDAGFMAIMTGEGDDAEAVKSDTATAMDNKNLGKVSFSSTLMPEMLAKGSVPFHVRVTPVAVAEDGTRTDAQSGVANGEMWEASGALTYEHTGLELPPGKDEGSTDLGPIRITFTTQSLTVGVYRETDDQPGFTDYRSDYPGGDHRPHTDGIEVELMYSESGGRLKRYDYMTFDGKGKRTVEAANPMDVPKWSAAKGTGGMVTFKHLPADKDFTVRLRAGSGRTVVGDRDVDAYGDALDDMSMGSFGTAGGTTPEVRLCPLTTTSRPDFLGDQSDDCATFAYQWTTGTVNATLTGLREKVKAKVTLDPVTDVHSEGDHKDRTGIEDAGEQEFAFTNVQDGVYRLVLTGADVKEMKSAELAIYHNESASDPDDAPASVDVPLDATSVRGMIRGVVANNRIGPTGNTISSDEAIGGVVLALHNPKKDAAGKITGIGTAVMNDGDPVRATTNDDGEYAFENLVDGTDYFVQVLECDGCVAYHDINDLHELVDHGQATATVYADDAPNKLPRWDYGATAVGSVLKNTDDGGFVDFVGLYEDGEIGGSVSVTNQTKRNAKGHRIELARCLIPHATNPTTECGEYEDEFSDVGVTDENGEWSVSGLREGRYIVTINPRGSFDVVVGSGTTAAEHSVAVLLDGGAGSAADAETFKLVDGGKSELRYLTALSVTTTPGTGNSTTSNANTTGWNHDADADDNTATPAKTASALVQLVNVSVAASGDNYTLSDGTTTAIADDVATINTSAVTFGTAIGTQAFANTMVLSATAYDDDASISVAVTTGASHSTPDDDDFAAVGSGARKELDLPNPATGGADNTWVTVRVTSARGDAHSDYFFGFQRTPAEEDYSVTGVIVAPNATYGVGYTTAADGTVDQSSNVSGALNVELAATAVGTFTVTVNHGTNSDRAAVTFQVGDGPVNEGTVAGSSGSMTTVRRFDVPSTSMTIKITVASEANQAGLEDTKTKKYSTQKKVWTLVVTKASS